MRVCRLGQLHALLWLEMKANSCVSLLSFSNLREAHVLGSLLCMSAREHLGLFRQERVTQYSRN